MDLKSNNLVTTHLKNEKTKFWDEMEKILDDIFSEQVIATGKIEDGRVIKDEVIQKAQV